MNKTINVEFVSNIKILSIQLSGIINSDDLIKFQSLIIDCCEIIPDKSVIKVLIDLTGFEAFDLKVHKQFRNILPNTLLNLGWKIGYLKLFEEAKDIKPINIRGIQCIALAYCHHDESKMINYEANCGSEYEHYFTNSKIAFEWLLGVKF